MKLVFEKIKSRNYVSIFAQKICQGPQILALGYFLFPSNFYFVVFSCGKKWVEGNDKVFGTLFSLRILCMCIMKYHHICPLFFYPPLSIATSTCSSLNFVPFFFFWIAPKSNLPINTKMYSGVGPPTGALAKLSYKKNSPSLSTDS